MNCAVINLSCTTYNSRNMIPLDDSTPFRRVTDFVAKRFPFSFPADAVVKLG